MCRGFIVLWKQSCFHPNGGNRARCFGGACGGQFRRCLGDSSGGLYWSKCSFSVQTTNHSDCPFPASFLIKDLSSLLHKTLQLKPTQCIWHPSFTTKWKWWVKKEDLISYFTSHLTSQKVLRAQPHLGRESSLGSSATGPTQHGMNGLRLRTVTSKSNEPPCPRCLSAHLRGQASFKCKCTSFIYPEWRCYDAQPPLRK